MASKNISTQFSILPAYKLKGHKSAVLCCATAGCRIASGAEDGLLLIHDLHASTSIATTPTSPVPSSADSSGAWDCTGRPREALATTKPLFNLPFTGPDGRPAPITALASHPLNPETNLFVAAGSFVHNVDLRAPSVVQMYSSSQEDINGLSVSGRGSHLAAGDDAGEVQVYDLAAGRLFKGIRNVHRSICSSVAFRAHKPWDLITGGMDSTVAKYDFSRPKCVDRWDMNVLAMGSGPSGGGGGGSMGTGVQIFNPPFVHQIAVAAGDVRPTCQWVAAARGDGAVVVLDADVSSATSGASGPTTQVTMGARGRGGGGGADGGGHGRASRSTGAKGKRSAPMQPLILDRYVGGHTLPVCSVTFAPCSSWTGSPSQEQAARPTVSSEEHVTVEACRLYSGGEDCRIILWDVGGALQARAAGSALVDRAAAAGHAAGSGAGDVGAVGTSVDGAEVRAMQGGIDARSCSPRSELEGAEGGTVQIEGRVVVLAEVRHGRKVNQLCSLNLDGKELVAVAAVSKFVTVYRTYTAL